MKLQIGSFAMMGSNYALMNKEATATNNTGMNNRPNKTGNQNTSSISLSSNSQFDKMIERIQEQIQKVQENDKYDADTKKSKVEELEKQLKEIEEAKAEQLKESVLDPKKKSETNNANSNGNNADEKSNGSGVLVDISFDAKVLLEADNSLKQLKSANSMKVRLEGASNVLAYEIKIDKSRGVDTTKKEEQHAKMQEGIEKSMENMGETIKDINNITNDTSEDTRLTSNTDNESRVEKNNSLAETSSNVLENTTLEKTASEEKIDAN